MKCGAYTVKHYELEMSVFHGKLACLSKSVKVTGNYKKILAYHVICPFSLNYEFVMFYITGPWGRLSLTRKYYTRVFSY